MGSSDARIDGTNATSDDDTRLVERARSTDDIAELRRFLANTSAEVRSAAAENPNLDAVLDADRTQGGTLETRLVDDPSINVVFRLVKNPHAPAQLLARLATHRSALIRAQVAAHPSTPPATLARLAADIASVRVAVAGNWAAHDETIAPLVVAAARQGTEVARRRTASLWPDEVNDAIRLLLASGADMTDTELLDVAITTAGLDGTGDRTGDGVDTGTATAAVTP